MTKATLPFTFADAVKRTTARIDDTELERLFGRNWSSTVQTWRNDSNPRWPRIDQALALDIAYAAAGGDGSPFLDSFRTQVNDARKDRAEACRVALVTASAALAKDYGDLVAATFDVMLPDATQRDKDRALVEVQEVVTRVDAVVRLLKSFCRRGAGSRSQKTGGIS